MKTNMMKLLALSTLVIALVPVSFLNAASLKTQTYTFTYKPKNLASFKISKTASTQEEAFKTASRECFQKLTQGQYPGDEKGLDYIDVCANPKM